MKSSSRSGLSRRNILRSASAAGVVLMPQMLAAQSVGAPGQKTNTVAGRKFRAIVSAGFGPNTTRLEELTLLPISGRQILVRTEVTQCCYTLTSRVLGSQDPPDSNDPQNRPIMSEANLPVIDGHGGVGIVEAIGPEVRRVQVGDRVIVPVTAQCGQCYHCLRGRADRCQFQATRNLVAIAQRSNGSKVYGRGNIGGMSEVMVAAEEAVVPVFTGAKSIDLAMLHCVGGCGLGTAMTLAPVEPGSNVAVWGGGPVGLSAVQGARIMGAAQIILIEPIRVRRELGLKVGATTAFDPNAEGANLVNKVKDLCKGPTNRIYAGGRDDDNRGQIAAHVGPDFVIEAVGCDRGVPKMEAGPDPTGILPLKQVWQACPTGGHICTTGVGHPPQATISFPVNQWANGSKSHHPSQFGGTNSMRDIPRYVKLIDTGRYDAASLITSTYPLEKFLDAYREVLDRTTVTAMIVMS